MKKLYYFFYLCALVSVFFTIIFYHHSVSASKKQAGMVQNTPLIDDEEHGFKQYLTAAPAVAPSKSTSDQGNEPFQQKTSASDRRTTKYNLIMFHTKTELESAVKLIVERDAKALDNYCYGRQSYGGLSYYVRGSDTVKAFNVTVRALEIRPEGWADTFWVLEDSLIYAMSGLHNGIFADADDDILAAFQMKEKQPKVEKKSPPDNSLDAAQKPDGAQVMLARRAYYTKIWSAVRQNWALPEELKSQRLETILIVTVRRDGKVLDLKVEKGSGNASYDDSAKQAVRKADPLPPFPDIYTAPQEEIALRFTPELLS